MNKHTPGPWALDRTPTYWGLKHPHTGRLLAQVAHSQKANSEANATLIAAAPEMLDALRKAVVLLAGACVHSPELEPHETYEAVSAAIAKATGQQLAEARFKRADWAAVMRAKLDDLRKYQDAETLPDPVAPNVAANRTAAGGSG